MENNFAVIWMDIFTHGLASVSLVAKQHFVGRSRFLTRLLITCQGLNTATGDYTGVWPAEAIGIVLA
ncbi:hypothetical protein LP419_24520 [Massilia sp. H-1]|nr:hypothetical protein LP419_24520 [Massilia sp. H-1]